MTDSPEKLIHDMNSMSYSVGWVGRVLFHKSNRRNNLLVSVLVLYGTHCSHKTIGRHRLAWFLALCDRSEGK